MGKRGPNTSERVWRHGGGGVGRGREPDGGEGTRQQREPLPVTVGFVVTLLTAGAYAVYRRTPAIRSTRMPTPSFSGSGWKRLVLLTLSHRMRMAWAPLS
jgi:hypothetical protein